MAGNNNRKKRSKSSSAKPQDEHETDTETETELEESTLQTLLDKQTETISQRILADIETKIQKAINEFEHEIIGTHTFDNENITVHEQTTEIQESRHLPVEHCIKTRTRIMNTWF